MDDNISDNNDNQEQSSDLITFMNNQLEDLIHDDNTTSPTTTKIDSSKNYESIPDSNDSYESPFVLTNEAGIKEFLPDEYGLPLVEDPFEPMKNLTITDYFKIVRTHLTLVCNSIASLLEVDVQRNKDSENYVISFMSDDSPVRKTLLYSLFLIDTNQFILNGHLEEAMEEFTKQIYDGFGIQLVTANFRYERSVRITPNIEIFDSITAIAQRTFWNYLCLIFGHSTCHNPQRLMRCIMDFNLLQLEETIYFALVHDLDVEEIIAAIIAGINGGWAFYNMPFAESEGE